VSHNVYRDGFVYVCREMCSTCVFRPGNKMELRSGRVRQMVDEAKEHDSTIVCHKTLDGDSAACRGFFDRHKTPPLQIAERLNLVKLIDPGER
jgi:hypothetical protein